MLLEEFDYDLPPELIANTPVPNRDESRLMVIDKMTGDISHHQFKDVCSYLKPDDCLVLNNTKVFNARIFGVDSKVKSFEIFLLKQRNSKLNWECLVCPGKKIKDGVKLSFQDNVEAWVKPSQDDNYEISFKGIKEENFFPWLSKHGKVPLPPYIKRSATLEDVNTYQTVYARHLGSIAAPTAGFHFTEQLLNEIAEKRVSIAEITLHVGYGTFSPVRTENIEDHKLHSETYSVSDNVLALLEKTKKSGNRVIAVGTTSLRTLESLPFYGQKGSTDLYIQPGFQFQWVDGLITNFHLPKSSLYILIAAFLGLPTTRACYEEAISHKYRFYSYGDAMVIL